jgi:quercetin dioxygenase-like cupin family protein
MSTATLSLPAAPPRSSHAKVPTTTLADIVEGLAVAPSLWNGLLPGLGTERSSVRLLETDAYDVWVIAWPPGTRVEPHDHGSSAGAFTVVHGTLTEYRWAPEPRSRTIRTGEVVTIDARVVHDVVADRPHDGLAISVHAYSPPLREMGFYSDDGAHLLTRVAVSAEPLTDGGTLPQAAIGLHEFDALVSPDGAPSATKSLRHRTAAQ